MVMRRTTVITLTIALSVALVSGCGDDDGTANGNNASPDAGVGVDAIDSDAANTNNQSADADSEPDADKNDLGAENGAGETDLDYETVWETLDTAHSCSNGYCHGGSAPNIQSYDLLIDVTSDCDESPRVAPGDPEGSLLWRKISPDVDAGDVCGDKMPSAAGVDQTEAQMVYDWIAAGAPE